jgi:hypothetical protein
LLRTYPDEIIAAPDNHLGAGPNGNVLAAFSGNVLDRELLARRQVPVASLA